MDSKDSLSNEVEEGFLDLATSCFDEDSCQNPTCNYPLPPLPFLHEFKDPYSPIMSEVYVISFQGNMLMQSFAKPTLISFCVAF